MSFLWDFDLKKGSTKPSHYLHRSTPKSKKSGTSSKALMLTSHYSSGTPLASTALTGLGDVAIDRGYRQRKHRRQRGERTQSRANGCSTTTTTTAGEDDEKVIKVKKSRKVKKHLHTSSFKQIKHSLKRSQKYLNNFYACSGLGMGATATGTEAESTTSNRDGVKRAAESPVQRRLKPDTTPTLPLSSMDKVTVSRMCTCDRRAGSVTNPTVVTGEATRTNESDRRSAVSTGETMPNGSSNGNKSEMSKNGGANNTHSSSKSSTSAYVSATHSLTSSHSSLCSNFNQVI